MNIAFGHFDVRGSRRLALVLVAATGAAVAVPPARASAASARYEGYFAAPGETNNLTVTANGATLTYVDTGAPIMASDGCLPAGANAAGTPVVCRSNPLLPILLDDGNDETTFVGVFDFVAGSTSSVAPATTRCVARRRRPASCCSNR